MCIINIDGSAVNYTEGMTYIDAIRAANPERADGALAVRVAGIIRGLDEKIQPDADAVTLDFTNEEGRRVYERSLRFVFLLAMHQMYPGKRVRFENSMGGGVYITLPDDVFLSTPAVSRIQARMRELISADMPFTRMEVSQAEALDYFEDCGWDDKVELLRYRAEENFCLYECGGLKEYFYGVMAPSTGYVRTFALHFCMPGIMLMLPDKADCTRPRPFIEQPKLARVLAETARWNEILGCSNVADLNRMTIDRSLREFIRVNEALQARAIADIADRFVESGARVMLIAGPSSSGKTTFTHRMAIELRVLGLKPLLISLDDYYLSRDEMTPRADGTYDLEALEALDVRLFNEQLVSLLQGQSVHLSRFDFTKKRRSLSDTATQLMPGQPIIIEGIHGLNDALTRVHKCAHSAQSGRPQPHTHDRRAAYQAHGARLSVPRQPGRPHVRHVARRGARRGEEHIPLSGARRRYVQFVADVRAGHTKGIRGAAAECSQSRQPALYQVTAAAGLPKLLCRGTRRGRGAGQFHTAGVHRRVLLLSG